MKSLSSIISIFVIVIVYSAALINGQLPPPSWWNQRVSNGQLLSSLKVEPTQYLMASVGNGYAAYVVGGDAIYVGGVYNGPQVSTSAPSHRAAIPNFQNIQVGGGAVLNYAGLDIENATYTRHYSFPNQSISTTVQQVFYAYYPIMNALVQEITIDNSGNQNSFELLLSTPSSLSTPDMNVEQIDNVGGFTVYNASILQPELENGLVISVAISTTNVPSSIVIGSGQVETLYFTTILFTNMDTSNYYLESIITYKIIQSMTTDLQVQHIQAWSQLWQSRIEVGGNLELAQVVNSSLYYIMSSIRQDYPWSLSPGGLASDGYNGHVFWDAETWMYPPLLLLYPEIAGTSLIQYRVNHLEGAALKAQSYDSGYQGYMFPWESAESGEEVCPTFAPTGLLEQHITGDISFATRQYYYATGEMVDYGFIKGMAEFWASRVENYTDSVTGNIVYVIDGVIPPDEYAVGVNNSVYTNTIAKMALQWAIEAAEIVGDTSSIPVQHWQDIIDNMFILFDETNQYHPEYEGYNGETVKQADVILLGFPLMQNMTQQVRENDLTYYENKTDSNGPAMTHSMFMVGWLEVGNLEKAYKEWSLSYANSQQPFGVWTETPTGGTVNFITGAGGFLQGVLFGYGGIRIQQKSLDFNPQLPPSTSSLSIKGINYWGSTFDLYWDTNVIVLELTSISNVDFILLPSDLPIQLNQPLTLKSIAGSYSIIPK